MPARRGAGPLPSSPFPVLGASGAGHPVPPGSEHRAIHVSPGLPSLGIPWWPWLCVPRTQPAQEHPFLMDKASMVQRYPQNNAVFCYMIVTKARGISELVFIERGAKMASGNKLDGYDLLDHTFTSLLRGCKQHCSGSLNTTVISI